MLVVIGVFTNVRRVCISNSQVRPAANYGGRDGQTPTVSYGCAMERKANVSKAFCEISFDEHKFVPTSPLANVVYAGSRCLTATRTSRT